MDNFATKNIYNLLRILRFLILRILSIGVYISLTTRLWYLLEHHMLVLFESTESYINQLEFDPKKAYQSMPGLNC